MGTPWGLHGDSMGNSWGLSVPTWKAEQTNSVEIINRSWGLHVDSSWTPWGLHGEFMGPSWGRHGEFMGTPWGLHGDSMGNS